MRPPFSAYQFLFRQYGRPPPFTGKTIVAVNVGAWYQRLLDKGLTVGPPHRLEQFGIHTFFIEDPNGYQVEFHQFDS